MKRPANFRALGRYGLSAGSLGLMVGAVVAYLHHARTGQVIMFAGAALLVVGAILIANFNPPSGGNDAL